MNDKELADAVVALGVGVSANHGGMVLYSIDHGSIWLRPEEFNKRWTVAGALMEKVDAHFIERLSSKMWAVRSDRSWAEGITREWYENESLPTAIIQACVEGLEAK